ncbi:MAG: hypothetical protein ABI874_11480, partial [Chloroflexota bacterium]
MDAKLRRAFILHWLAREPWLTSTQLSDMTGEANIKLMLHYLHDVAESGWVQKVNIGEPMLPSEYVYALTDAGMRELARVEGVSCGALSRRYRINESVLLSVFNRLPFIYEVRQHLLCPLKASSRQFADVQLRVWSWRRHLKHHFQFKGWHSATRYHLQPDAYGVLVSRGRAFPFFVWWDPHGAAPPDVERRRLTLFYQARDSGQLPFDWLHFPALVIVAASPRRATEYRVMLQEFGERRGASALLNAFIVEVERLRATGPLAPIWIQAGRGEQRVGFLQGAPYLSEQDYLRAFQREQWAEVQWATQLRFDAPNPRPARLLGVELTKLNDAAQTLAQRMSLANLKLKPHEKDVLKWIGGQGAVLPSHVRRYYAREGETVRSWLARLKRYGLLVELHPPADITAQTLYALSDDGLTLMALKENQPVEHYGNLYRVRLPRTSSAHGIQPTDAPPPDEQPVFTWRLLRHRLEVAERMLAFAEAARAETRSRRSKQSLEVWEGETRAAIEWRSQQTRHRLYPDAYGLYRIGDERIGFWLEADRSHYKLRSDTQAWYTFTRKVRAYYAYFKHLWLLGLSANFPTLLVVTSTLARMRSLRHIFVET